MVQFGSDRQREGAVPFSIDTSGRLDGSQSYIEAQASAVSNGEQILTNLQVPNLEKVLCQAENLEVQSLVVPFLRLLETKEARGQLVLVKQDDIISMFVTEIPEMRDRRDSVFNDLSGLQKVFVTLTSGMYTPRVLASFYQEASQLLCQLLIVLKERGLVEARGFRGLITDRYHGIGSIVIPYNETAIRLTEKGRELLMDQT